MSRREKPLLDEIAELLMIAPIWFGPVFAGIIFALLYWIAPGLMPTGEDVMEGTFYDILSGLSIKAAPIMLVLTLIVWCMTVLRKSASRGPRSNSEPPKQRRRVVATLVCPPPAPVASSETYVSPPQPERRCPKCDSMMVLRTARKGANPGSQFWGCSRFPKCRETREITR